MKIIDDAVLKRTMENLESNNFETFFVANKEGVVPLVKALVPAGSVVSNGGSVSLQQCGVMDLLRSGDYQFIDRETAKTPKETQEIYRQAYCSDTYFCSSNAVTENGELYNVDGNSNRISCIAYGPEQVIMVVGVNKIVKNTDEAINRVKTVCAPENCKRLGIKNYCAGMGECISLKEKSPTLCDGCKTQTRICCNYLISAKQRHKNRIKIILVGEEIGY